MIYENPYEDKYLYITNNTDFYRLEKIVDILSQIPYLKGYSLFFQDLRVSRRCLTASMKEVFKDIRKSVGNLGDKDFLCGMAYGIIFSLSFFEKYAIQCEYEVKKELKEHTRWQH